MNQDPSSFQIFDSEALAADYAVLITLGCVAAPDTWSMSDQRVWQDALNQQASADGLAVDVVNLSDERVAPFAVLSGPTGAYDCSSIRTGAELVSRIHPLVETALASQLSAARQRVSPPATPERYTVSDRYLRTARFAAFEPAQRYADTARSDSDPQTGTFASVRLDGEPIYVWDTWERAGRTIGAGGTAYELWENAHLCMVSESLERARRTAFHNRAIGRKEPYAIYRAGQLIEVIDGRAHCDCQWCRNLAQARARDADASFWRRRAGRE